MIKRKIENKEKGFSILEVVAAIFIFSIVTITIYGSFSAGLNSVAQSKHRVSATELANEKMEIIRNMSYADIGTEGGVPGGILPQEETVWKSNQKFSVRTAVIYVDDALDGVAGGDPNDEITKDYKEARVEVIWAGISWGKGVTLVSRFVPNGVESESGGGTFVLNVIDSTGQGISGVEAHIVNNEANPQVNITTQTDSSGSILMAGMPAGDRNYEIGISKDAYESVSTLPPYPDTAYDPTDTHGSVEEGGLSSKTIISDQTGTITITSEDLNSNLIPNMDFHLAGGRIIGTTRETPVQSVFSYNQDTATDGNGTLTLDDMSPGNYTVNFTEAGYTLIGTEAPLLHFSLAPGQILSVTLLVVNNGINSLITSVTNPITKEPVSGASVRVFDGAGFDQTLITGDSGRVYFPPNLDLPVTMNSGPYSIEVTAGGYTSYSGSIEVSQLTQTAIELNPL
ncbi:MAG: prepilin-type N-terminal cleavage/methylation domain-containing protein [Parcubacteria group bacterium]|jgi:type II secretory pathway pseudopilin PulG